MIIPNFVGFFLFKSKTKVAYLFWKHEAFVQDQSSCRLCAIKSYNEKEYANDTFNIHAMVSKSFIAYPSQVCSSQQNPQI